MITGEGENGLGRGQGRVRIGEVGIAEEVRTGEGANGLGREAMGWEGGERMERMLDGRGDGGRELKVEGRAIITR